MGGPVPPGGPFPGAPYGPPRRKGGGKALAILIGAAALVVLLGVGGYAIYFVRTSHTLSTPAVADGLSRDYPAESGTRKAVDKLTDIIYAAGTDWKVRSTVSAVYGNGGEKYLFVGVNGDHKLKDPEIAVNGAFSAEFRDSGGTTYRVSTFKSQDAGGDGVALGTNVYAQTQGPTGTTSSTTFFASWSTRTTFAIITRIAIDDEHDRHKDVQDTMRDIRADVED
ncbi:hypothetical protein HUT06_31595 [Actinomadura sp. NAK00032]|uniref:hypothetical protein n=1 Tax=Actinomadura sp. NAK00032 TaxID=2742128 RepID=UPI001590D23A|nr:hypothetical protein [Actinomadura sp. NAK00032]QKW37988.1 hypothetical protein HUT06_31595 [Actinomadura sp. NAK00032]